MISYCQLRYYHIILICNFKYWSREIEGLEVAELIAGLKKLRVKPQPETCNGDLGVQYALFSLSWTNCFSL